MLYFYGEKDEPLKNPLYTYNELEMLMKEGGSVSDFSPPDCQVTDWLLVQMQMFGNTFDGFLCDLGQTNNKCKLVADLVRMSLNNYGEAFTKRCLSETNLIGFVFAIKLIAFSCACEERLDKDEYDQFLVKLDNLCGKKISNYPR